MAQAANARADAAHTAAAAAQTAADTANALPEVLYDDLATGTMVLRSNSGSWAAAERILFPRALVGADDAGTVAIAGEYTHRSVTKYWALTIPVALFRRMPANDGRTATAAGTLTHYLQRPVRALSPSLLGWAEAALHITRWRSIGGHDGLWFNMGSSANLGDVSPFRIRVELRTMSRLADVWSAFRGEARREEARSYTDLTVAMMVARASGKSAVPQATGAAQGAAGLLGRALAAAKVEPDTRRPGRSRRPSLRHRAESDLRGESVWWIEVAGGAVRLRRAATWDIGGTARRWCTRWTSPARRIPSGGFRPGRVFSILGSMRLRLPRGAGVLRTSAAPRRRGYWRGSRGRLLLRRRPAPGGLLPAPIEGMEPESLTALKGDLASLDGKAALVPTMTAGWSEGTAGAPVSDWKQQRVGLDPPQFLVGLRGDVEDSATTGAGVPLTL